MKPSKHQRRFFDRVHKLEGGDARFQKYMGKIAPDRHAVEELAKVCIDANTNAGLSAPKKITCQTLFFVDDVLVADHTWALTKPQQ